MCSHFVQLSHCIMGRVSSGRAQMQRVAEGESEFVEVERAVEGVVVREEVEDWEGGKGRGWGWRWWGSVGY